MFYDSFISLCEKKGVSRTKACIDCGLSRTAWNKWQGGAVPNGETINRLADYFGVTTDRLLGTETEKDLAKPGEVSEADLKFALFGAEATDKRLEEVRRFAQFIKERDKK